MSRVDDVLAHAHDDLRATARRNRRAFRLAPLGKWARAMWDAMGEYHAARQAGVSREDACKGLEIVIRDTWPKPTTKFPPKCDACADTGWRDMTCWDQQRCGRRNCVERGASWEHAYVVPCDCQKGDRFRPKVCQPDDAVVAVGRTQKPKRGGFRRLGA